MKEKSSPGFRLDEQVYFTLGAVALLSLLVLAFKFISNHPCEPITLTNQSNSYEKGNSISFKAETIHGKNYAWNFGDGTTDKEQTENTILHKYEHAGTYTVRVTVNGECSEFQNIVITEARVIENVDLTPNFEVPDSADVNQKVEVKCHSTQATKWEWYFEDPNRVDATTQTASHVYKTPGSKRIYLKINGRNDLATYRSIYIIDRDAINRQARAKEKRTYQPPPIVIAKDPTAPPLTSQPAIQQEAPKKEEEKPKPKAPDFADSQLEAVFMDISKGSKKPDDLSSYVCGNLSIPVIYNSTKTSLAALCETLKNKKIKTIKVNQFKDPTTNCIGSMVVNVEFKKVLGIF